jgi:hypothetical protein
MQDLLHYPLRSYVAPFLRGHLPLLQSELLQLSRLMNQPLSHLIRQQPAYVLEPLPVNRSFGSSALSSHVFTALSAEIEQLCSEPSLQHSSMAPQSTLLQPLSASQSNPNPLKRRFSPDLHHQSLKLAPQSPPSKVAAKHSSIPVSSTSASLNTSSLHAHLTQARAAMLEELMTNGYQAQVAQQLNLVNQQLNQQIAAAHKARLAQATLPTLPPLNVTGNSSFYSNGGASSPHKPIQLSLDRVAMIDRYEKEFMVYPNSMHQSSIMSQHPTQSQIVSQTNGNRGSSQPSPFVRNGIGRESCLPGTKLSSVPVSNAYGEFVNRPTITRRETARTSPVIAQRDNEDEWRNIYTVSTTTTFCVSRSVTNSVFLSFRRADAELYHGNGREDETSVDHFAAEKQRSDRT